MQQSEVTSPAVLDAARAKQRRMVDAAKRRALVRCSNGQVATLISWGTARGRSYVRLEGSDGVTRWSEHKSFVVGLLEDEIS